VLGEQGVQWRDHGARVLADPAGGGARVPSAGTLAA
jgi:hypothetical protein